ncbi:hypothetical protein SELMODRAFT_402041 [Selaginella moellendorffii]|uniref:Uncharacterized protein n=1 Tax=Selaginella moellendorffii TaxID=88036 RepID=D8QPE4_SELML|nr:hypothetical protein SELMODRAFT_402041 [Selaginella moellendorffii]
MLYSWLELQDEKAKIDPPIVKDHIRKGMVDEVPELTCVDYVELKADELFKLDTEEKRDKAAGLRAWSPCRGTVDIRPANVIAVHNRRVYSDPTTSLLNMGGKASEDWDKLVENAYVRPVVKNQQSGTLFHVGEGQVPSTSSPRTSSRRVRMFQMCVKLDHPVKWDG